MKAMGKAFTRVDETFEAIRDSLNQQAINNIARKLAQDLRRAQQARIRSQKAPDGTAWTPRRRRVTRIQERIRFIWNNEARTLKNWHHDTGKYGRTITGWDEDKNNIRTFYRDDIDRFLEIRTRRINQDSTKRVPMFVKLRTARYCTVSAELMRLLSNIIRTGIISEVDEKSWRVRVRSGELETGWLRWNTTRAGAFNVWLPPSPGEQVVIACIGGNPETAMIIGSLWSDASPAPGKSLKEIVVSAPDGAVFRYDADAGALSASGMKTATLQARTAAAISPQTVSQCIRISTVALKVAAIRQEARSDNPLHRNEPGRNGKPERYGAPETVSQGHPDHPAGEPGYATGIWQHCT